MRKIDSRSELFDENHLFLGGIVDDDVDRAVAQDDVPHFVFAGMPIVQSQGPNELGVLTLS